MTPEQTRLIRIGGRRIRVRIRAGQGVPLVMCNGIGAGLEILDPLVATLAPQRTVIRFDVPGAGGSAAPMVPYTIFQVARWMGVVVKELGRDRVDVLGYSWGGALAQQFALQNPRRCRRLVLIATSTGVLMMPAKPSVTRKMFSPRRFTDPEYLAAVAATLYGGAAHHSDATVERLAGDRISSGSRRGYLYQLLAGSVWTSLFALRLIRQQALIVAGTDDPIIPYRNALILAALLPNSTLLTHDGGHIDILTSATCFGPRIEEFLAGDATQGGVAGAATADECGA